MPERSCQQGEASIVRSLPGALTVSRGSSGVPDQDSQSLPGRRRCLWDSGSRHAPRSRAGVCMAHSPHG